MNRSAIQGSIKLVPDQAGKLPLQVSLCKGNDKIIARWNILSLSFDISLSIQLSITFQSPPYFFPLSNFPIGDLILSTQIYFSLLFIFFQICISLAKFSWFILEKSDSHDDASLEQNLSTV